MKAMTDETATEEARRIVWGPEALTTVANLLVAHDECTREHKTGRHAR